MTESTQPRKTPAKATIASWVGTTLEYYDFAVYATASALVFNQLFFPPGLPEGVRLMLSLATLGVGYLVRPLGAFILGPLGDRFGRKPIMLAAIGLFVAGAALCIFATSMTQLAAFRAVQGLGGGGQARRI